MSQQLSITAEGTPNPNTVKFNVNRTLLEKGTANFKDKEAATGSPLPEKLFEFDAVESVFIGRTFISITKKPEADWESLIPVTHTMKDVLTADIPLVDEERITPNITFASGDTEIEKRIMEVLDTRVRPAVARDGGDINYEGYQNGIVLLRLEGSCGTCPSSMMTLKMGVENMLKAEIPEIQEVIQL
ncbi:MAG: NifU family protein [Armatimonadetes bacterium]|nr:NifU family protein [Armatimonadota bacterium]